MYIRKRIYEIIEIAEPDDYISHAYDIFMIAIIIISIIPLAMKTISHAWRDIENICVYIFIADYIFRFLTADYKMDDKSMLSFIKYPFTPLAVIDLLSILPHFIVINSGFGLLRLIRLAKALRVFRIFKIFRYSTNIDVVLAVVRRSRDSLIAVGTLTVAYILTSALIVLNVEPQTFDNFYEAVYWATVSLTTIGYGDIIPVSFVGRLVTMLSSFFGIAVIALPSGIITTGFMDEIHERQKNERKAKRKSKADDYHHKE